MSSTPENSGTMNESGSGIILLSASSSEENRKTGCAGCMDRILKSQVSYLLKYILFFFNCLLLTVGLLMLGLGIWQLVMKHLLTDNKLYSVSTVINVVASVCIIIGLFVVVLSSAACVGALRENIYLLRFFYWSVTVAVVMEISAAVTAAVFRANVRKVLEGALSKQLVVNYEDDADAKFLLDIFQSRAGCCGVTGYTDWNSNSYYNCSASTESRNQLTCAVPYSCCLKPDSLQNGVLNIFCGAGILELQKTFAQANVYAIGCVDRLVEIIDLNQATVIGIVLLVIVPQLAGILLTKLLEYQIRAQIEGWNY